MYNYYLEEGFPLTGRKLTCLKNFLAKSDLDYDEHIEYSVLLYTQDGELAATGSHHRNVLKCLAVSNEHQGEGYMNAVMSQLMTHAHMQGHSHLFLFTKPKNTAIFEDLGFYSILCTESIQLMENVPNGISQYLERETAWMPVPESNMTSGAIVMNANPFTLGHLHLIKEARKRCDILHVFVLSEPAPPFTPEERFRLVQEGCAEIPGVYVHGGSEYLISHTTFPDYFLKDKKTALNANSALDLLLFCRYFKEAFHITRRFVGEEPFCPLTNAYNQQMQNILPQHGIEVCILPRLCVNNTAVSATQVRRLLTEGHLEEISTLVPYTTWRFLKEKYDKGAYNTNE